MTLDRTERNKETQKKQYRKRKSAGLCVACGKPTEGTVLCEEHRIISNARCEKWRKNNLKKDAIQSKRWREENPEKYKASTKASNKKRKEKLNAKVREMYGSECYLKDALCSGRLEIDHINGRQFDKREPVYTSTKTHNTEKLFRWLIEEKREGFVTLCNRHNFLKGGLPPDKMIEYAEKLQKLL